MDDLKFLNAPFRKQVCVSRASTSLSSTSKTLIMAAIRCLEVDANSGA